MTELKISNLNKRYGGNHVLKDVSFTINGAELIGLIGPNGAGKTTLTNVLDGAVKPNSGTVYLNGKRIDQLPSFEVAKSGLGRTFQVTRSFRRMTVLENLYVPALALGKSYKGGAVQKEALEVLDFLTMGHRRNQPERFAQCTACDVPISLGSNQLPAPVFETKPLCEKFQAKPALLEAILISHWDTNSAPIPTAGPPTTTITGFGHSTIGHHLPLSFAKPRSSLS